MKHRSKAGRRSKGAIALRSAVVVGAITSGALALWYAINHVPWFGVAMANGARAVVGPAPVAWAENTLYDWQDRWNRWRYGDCAPVTYWASPSGSSAISPTSAPEGQTSSGFSPAPVAPPYRGVAAPGDGLWLPAANVGARTVMFKTLVHPDPKRPFAAMAIVAMDMSALRLHAVPGTAEPKPKLPVPASARTGLVEQQDLDTLLAAFNGGFLATHGNYGMMVNGTRLLNPKRSSCTIALYKDGAVRVRSWTELEATESQMTAFRQTPQCLVERGRYNPALSNENTAWGCAVGGSTVIRRSAIGMSQDGAVLYFGMGDALTAKSVADGMQAAGAYDVAQLDVNHYFPRFLFYDKKPGAGPDFAVTALVPSFTFTPGDYVKKSSYRDFFYVTFRGPATT